MGENIDIKELLITLEAEPYGVQDIGADEILSTEYPEPDWLVPDILPLGLSILASAPKLGKSWLALQLCLELGRGGSFLGHKLEKGTSLYFALEDPPRRLKSRMLKQGWSKDAPTYFVTLQQDGINLASREGLEKLEEHIIRRAPKLVIIDTISRGAYLEANKNEDVSAIYDKLARLASNYKICILLIDHHNKMTSIETADVTRNILGSTAKAGVADAILGLYRKRGSLDAQLIITGRDIEYLAIHITFDSDTGRWLTSEELPKGKLTEYQEEIIEVLSEKPLRLSEVAKAVGTDNGNTRQRLISLIKRGLVVKTLNGYYKLASRE